MNEPYTPNMIARILRTSTPEQFARLKPVHFQRWPTRNIVPLHIINELFDAETARRMA